MSREDKRIKSSFLDNIIDPLLKRKPSFAVWLKKRIWLGRNRENVKR